MVWMINSSFAVLVHSTKVQPKVLFVCLFIYFYVTSVIRGRMRQPIKLNLLNNSQEISGLHATLLALNFIFKKFSIYELT